MWLSIRLERLSPVGYVGFALDHPRKVLVELVRMWEDFPCGTKPSGLRPIEKCRCCQHPVATTFSGAACPDPSDTHPSCRGFEIAHVGLMPFIDRMLRKSRTESSSVVTGATDTEKAAEQTNEPPATHAEKQRAERERERKPGEKGEEEKPRKEDPKQRTTAKPNVLNESSVPECHCLQRNCVVARRSEAWR